MNHSISSRDPNTPPIRLDPGEKVMVWMPSKHMGNLLLSMKAIAALIERCSPGQCALVVDATYAPLVEAADFPAHILLFPRRSVQSGPTLGRLGSAWQFLRQVRRFGATTAVVVEGDAASQRFTRLGGFRQRIGPDIRYCRGFDLRVALDHGRAHRFHDYAAVAEAVTGEPMSRGYHPLAVPESARDDVNRLLAAEGIPDDASIALLHCGATKDYKQWPPEAFATVNDWLRERGVHTVLTGAGEADRKAISEVIHRAGHAPVNAHNRLDLTQLMALMQRSALFLGNDTGPTHLAAACGIPTFALFGPTDEHLWGPLGANSTIIRNPSQPCAADCQRRHCRFNHRCLMELGVDRVTGLLEAVLAPQRQ